MMTEHDDNSLLLKNTFELPTRERTNSEAAALISEKDKLNPYARQTATRATMIRKTEVLQ